ncbi:Uncharacterised protein [Salmonella enterica subsp. enterica serovar Bovismorbificans]|uniref:Uncharacterized protein n=1 Tax=Salmonella enterica subsp. enterica serovar Bovismorbificans TaxID=58097 RepID=A0A655E9S5_SALET|nr:Uncharacterised protein [Salmonella enterica subsp. enterica serovar Bovismorbificans]
MLRCPVTLTGHLNTPAHAALRGSFQNTSGNPLARCLVATRGILSGLPACGRRAAIRRFIRPLRSTRNRITRGGVTFVAGEFG